MVSLGYDRAQYSRLQPLVPSKSLNIDNTNHLLINWNLSSRNCTCHSKFTYYRVIFHNFSGYDYSIYRSCSFYPQSLFNCRNSYDLKCMYLILTRDNLILYLLSDTYYSNVHINTIIKCNVNN